MRFWALPLVVALVLGNIHRGCSRRSDFVDAPRDTCEEVRA
ncbi:hypothetical protein [Laspinema palackyanum]